MKRPTSGYYSLGSLSFDSDRVDSVEFESQLHPGSSHLLSDIPAIKRHKIIDRTTHRDFGSHTFADKGRLSKLKLFSGFDNSLIF